MKALTPRLTQSGLVLTFKIVTLLVSALVMFYQDLAIVTVDALQSEFMSYILAVPLLLVYLIYRKRKIIRATITLEPEPTRQPLRRSWILGALMFPIAFLFYSYGSYTFTPLEYHMFTLPIFITASILILFNTHTLRQLAFPILFLFFLVPPPSEIIYAIGTSLSEVSTHSACAIMNLFGYVVAISAEYGNPVIVVTQPSGTTLTFMIDIACSGVYSLMGFLLFATFIVYIARGKLWKRATTFIVGFPLIYLLNILRIITIVFLGYQYNMEFAMDVFHLLGGWILIFIGTLLLLVASEKILGIQLFTKKNVVSCSHCNQIFDSNEKFCQACGRLLKHVNARLTERDLLRIFSLIMSTILVVSIQGPVFALTRGPADILTQIAAEQEPTTEILPQMHGYTLSFIVRDKLFEERTGQDASLAYAYFPHEGESSRYIIWVSLEIAPARSCLHRWEVCLITVPTAYGRKPDATFVDLRDIQLVENPPIIARFFVFQHTKSNSTEAVLYWFETTIFSTNATLEQKHVKIGLIVYPVEIEDLQEIERQLIAFGIAIADYWQPLKTWSPIALLMSQNGAYLVTLSATTLGCILVVNVISNKSEKRTNRKALKKLSTHDQRILEAIRQTQKRTIPSTSNVTLTFSALNGENLDNMNSLELIPKLDSLKQVGIIKKEIISQQDEPIQVWKTHI